MNPIDQRLTDAVETKPRVDDEDIGLVPEARCRRSPYDIRVAEHLELRLGPKKRDQRGPGQPLGLGDDAGHL